MAAVVRMNGERWSSRIYCFNKYRRRRVKGKGERRGQYRSTDHSSSNNHTKTIKAFSGSTHSVSRLSSDYFRRYLIAASSHQRGENVEFAHLWNIISSVWESMQEPRDSRHWNCRLLMWHRSWASGEKGAICLEDFLHETNPTFKVFDLNTPSLSLSHPPPPCSHPFTTPRFSFHIQIISPL